MWRLVCSRGVKVEYDDIRTKGSELKGHWVFKYKFHGTNPVINEMNSTFVFRDGKILVHHDRASRWKWAKQALGIPKAASRQGLAVHSAHSGEEGAWRLSSQTKESADTSLRRDVSRSRGKGIMPIDGGKIRDLSGEST